MYLFLAGNVNPLVSHSNMKAALESQMQWKFKHIAFIACDNLIII